MRQNLFQNKNRFVKPQIRTHQEMKFIGVEVRTSYKLESSQEKARIPALQQKFQAEQIEDQIPNRIDSDLHFAIYTKYKTDHRGPFSFILSAEVSTLDTIPEGMVGVTVPTSKYLVFTAEGRMPDALEKAWKDVRIYFANNIDYQRAYTADFEVHDKECPDVVDVYIAVKE